MRLIIKITFIVSYVVIVSCGKNSPKPIENPINNQPKPVDNNPTPIDNSPDNNADKVDIYLAGFSPYANTFGVTRAVVWKNGSASLLSQNQSDARAITTQNKDIYIAGFNLSKNSKKVACYWKNNKLINLTDSVEDATAVAITVQGSDIYVAGQIENKTTNQREGDPCYWKNGILTRLPTLVTYRSYKVTGIAVLGTDVYVCGIYSFSDTQSHACFWKNGAFHSLKDNFLNTAAFGICVSGNDVYIAGNTAGKNIDTYATCWKNGVPTQLPAPEHSQARCIKAINNNIYIGGFSTTYYLPGKGVYWKNGTLNSVQGAIEVTDITTLNNNVYMGITPSNINFGQLPGYAVNETATQLSISPSSVTGITVLPR